jgi:hypothetical protein
MRVLMISGDRTVLHPDSHVAERMVMYGRAAEKIAIIVSAEGAPVRLSENVTVYPTGTSGRLSRIRGIVERGKALTDAFDLITAQDPFEYGVAALRLGKILHVPVELQLHTDIGSPYFRKEWKNMLRMLFVAARLRRAARVRVVSLRVASAVEALGQVHRQTADQVARVAPAVGEHEGGEGAGGRLAVGTRDRDGREALRHLPEHLEV